MAVIIYRCSQNRIIDETVFNDTKLLLDSIKPGPQGQVRDSWLCLMNRKDSKSEARNPKSETISNDQNSNDPNKRRIRHDEYDFVFGIRTCDI